MGREPGDEMLVVVADPAGVTSTLVIRNPSPTVNATRKA